MRQEQSLEQRAANLIPLDQFIELATYRDIEELLTDALALMIRTFNAKAGSLIFARVPPPLRIRQGEFGFDKDVVEQITRWEKTIENRINSTWEIQTPRLSPVSFHRLSDSGLTLLTIPLLSQVKVIGSIGLVFEAEQELDNYQHQVLIRFVRGVGNMAQLTEELKVTQQRLSQLGLLYQVGQTMASTFDLTKLLNDTLQLTTSVVDAAASALMLIDEKSNELVFEATHGEETVVHRQRIGLDEGIAGWVVTHGEPVIVNDVNKDERFSRKADMHMGALTRSIAAVPLQIKGKTIGVLEVLNKSSTEGFYEEDLRVMLTLAAQAAIAIENARLYQSLREEHDRIIQAQEDVRKELSRKLHDGAVQLLAAIAMDVEHIGRLLKLKPEAVFAELEALRKLVQQATREARIVLFELRPIILESQGLVPALRSYVNQLQDSEEFAVYLDDGNFSLQLNPKVAGTIFSIVQEAINNVKKHANAENVWINLAVDKDQFVVGIKDDGQGFDVKTIEREYDQRGSFGLLNMHERAELIDGFLAIESSQVEPEQGTVVTLRVPLGKTGRLR